MTHVRLCLFDLLVRVQDYTRPFVQTETDTADLAECDCTRASSDSCFFFFSLFTRYNTCLRTQRPARSVFVPFSIVFNLFPPFRLRNRRETSRLCFYRITLGRMFVRTCQWTTVAWFVESESVQWRPFMIFRSLLPEVRSLQICKCISS